MVLCATRQIHKKLHLEARIWGKIQPGEIIVVFTTSQGVRSLGYGDLGCTNSHRACRKHKKAELMLPSSSVILQATVYNSKSCHWSLNTWHCTLFKHICSISVTPVSQKRCRWNTFPILLLLFYWAQNTYLLQSKVRIWCCSNKG